MKKGICIFLLVLTGILACTVSGRAALTEEEQDAWYASLWDSIGSDTKELLGQLGIETVDAESLMNVSVFQIFSLVGNIIRGQAASPLKYCAAAFLIIMTVAFGKTFLPEEGAMRSRYETVGHLCVMFALLAGAGQAVRESMPAVTATEDFIIGMVPVFTGVIGMSGNPSLALSWGGAVLAFAETVSAFFADFIPAAGALGTAVCAAANLNTEHDFSGMAKTAAKAVTTVMAFAAGVFTAVLSIKDVIAGAADSVGVKGLKFVIGHSVPVVGSAIADALNSMAAGITMIRNTAGAFAVLALFLIDLVPVLRLVLWKVSMRMIAAAAGLLGVKRAAELSDSLNCLLSVILGVICFNTAVFIIAVSLVIKVKGS